MDKMGFVILLGLKGMSTEQRINYAEEFLGITFLPEHTMSYPIPSDLQFASEQELIYTCSNCGSSRDCFILAESPSTDTVWGACPTCKRGFVLNDHILPLPPPAEKIKGVPGTIQIAYDLARKHHSSKDYLSCENMCRDILIDVAVRSGSPYQLFTEHVDYLNAKGYSPNGWPKESHGDRLDHKIPLPDGKRSIQLLIHAMIVLKRMYEETL